MKFVNQVNFVGGGNIKNTQASQNSNKLSKNVQAEADKMKQEIAELKNKVKQEQQEKLKKTFQYGAGADAVSSYNRAQIEKAQVQNIVNKNVKSQFKYLQ